MAYRREMCVVRDSSAVCVKRSSSCRGGSDPAKSGATDLQEDHMGVADGATLQCHSCTGGSLMSAQ